jgi:thiol-disulfide isomerase/thioredoxin
MNASFPRRLWTAAFAAALLALPAAASTPVADDPDSPASVLGTAAPDWAFTRWVRGGPMTLERLRGKVVLVRWWTEGCHFCQATLPEIEALRKKYGPDGFVTVAVFHPKPPHEVSDRHVLEVAGELGYAGPVALDRDWVTLERYWLDGHPERNWTSVSFLIDREGVIRWAHGGGEYHLSSDPAHHVCDADAKQLESTIVELLAKKTAAVVK